MNHYTSLYMETPGVHRQAERLAALSEISKLISATTDADRVSLEIFNTLRERFGILGGVFGVRNQQSGKIEIVAASGFPAKPKRDPHYRWSGEVVENVIRTGYPQVVSDVREESSEKTSLSAQDNTWAICVPAKVRGRTTGAFMVEQSYRDKVGAFEDAINFLRIVAALMGQAHELQVRFNQSSPSTPTNATDDPQRIAGFIGSSPVMREVMQTIEQAGPGGATVLIRGESGTGKGMVARALHEVSPRREGPFVTVVCAALPETLLETALFGHEKGAFTGAVERKHGYLEEATGGTLFLDEIGDIPHSTQVKLLRFLQERTFERVGGTRSTSVDVRIIAATNRNLEAAVAAGRFREDLYYRLNVVPIVMPALRERLEDVASLVMHFVKKLSQEYGREVVFSGDAIHKLTSYPWPGNVRELENFIERLIVLAPDRLIAAKDISLPRTRVTASEEAIETTEPTIAHQPARPTLQELEREEVVRALESSGGVQTLAAQSLGISPRQLAYRMKKYGIAKTSVTFK